MEDDLTIQPLEPAPTPPDGTVEMHPDGNGATIYRTMTPIEVAAMMARYNADRAEG